MKSKPAFILAAGGLDGNGCLLAIGNKFLRYRQNKNSSKILSHFPLQVELQFRTSIGTFPGSGFVFEWNVKSQNLATVDGQEEADVPRFLGKTERSGKNEGSGRARFGLDRLGLPY